MIETTITARRTAIRKKRGREVVVEITTTFESPPGSFGIYRKKGGDRNRLYDRSEVMDYLNQYDFRIIETVIGGIPTD